MRIWAERFTWASFTVKMLTCLLNGDRIHFDQEAGHELLEYARRNNVVCQIGMLAKEEGDQIQEGGTGSSVQGDKVRECFKECLCRKHVSIQCLENKGYAR